MNADLKGVHSMHYFFILYIVALHIHPHLNIVVGVREHTYVNWSNYTDTTNNNNLYLKRVTQSNGKDLP